MKKIASKKINQYAGNSSLMDIEITYGDEVFKFNLFEELQINENIINKEITMQPSSYAFLGMLHKKLVRASKEKEKLAEREFAKAFVKIKKTLDNSTGRAHSKEVAKEEALLDVRYIKALKSYFSVKDMADTVEVALRAFEQRSFLVQTLSANLRKEH